MASPTVVSTNESATTGAGTSHVINLPPSIVAGNLLLIIIGKSVSSITMNALAGWSELIDESVAARAFTILYRVADGSEGATITLTSSANTKTATIAYQISGAEDPATQLPELSTVATGSGTGPNPTSCSVTGGPKDVLALAFFCMALEATDNDLWVTGTPANYSNTLMKTAGTAGTNIGVEVASAQRAANLSSDDPGAFTTTISTAWRAYTMMIHPSSAVPPEQPFVGGLTTLGRR